MKAKYKSFICPKRHRISVVLLVAIGLQFGVFSGSAQTGQYLYTGSETIITLNPGIYNITAYGAQGGWNNYDYSPGGLGAKMEGEFNFSASTTLTLLVGGAGEGPGAGGSGGSYVVNGSTPLVIAGGGGGAGYYIGGSPGLTGTDGGVGGNGGNGGNGGYGGKDTYNGGGGFGVSSGGFGGGGGGNGGIAGGGGGGYSGGGGAGEYGGGGGGGSIIDSSGITLAEISGVASPDDPQGNGEIIITPVPEPSTLGLLVVSIAAFLGGFTWRVVKAH